MSTSKAKSRSFVFEVRPEFFGFANSRWHCACMRALVLSINKHREQNKRELHENKDKYLGTREDARKKALKGDFK